MEQDRLHSVAAQSYFTESTNMTKESRPIIRIHDISIDKIIDREMNDQEYVDFQDQQKAQAAADKAAADKAAAKAALLAKLGITEDDAKLLLS